MLILIYKYNNKKFIYYITECAPGSASCLSDVSGFNSLVKLTADVRQSGDQSIAYDDLYATADGRTLEQIKSTKGRIDGLITAAKQGDVTVNGLWEKWATSHR